MAAFLGNFSSHFSRGDFLLFSIPTRSLTWPLVTRGKVIGYSTCVYKSDNYLNLFGHFCTHERFTSCKSLHRNLMNIFNMINEVSTLCMQINEHHFALSSPCKYLVDFSRFHAIFKHFCRLARLGWSRLG